MKVNKMITSVFLVLILFIAACSNNSTPPAATNPAPANNNANTAPASTPQEEPKKEIEFKNVKLIIDYPPGGGFDTMARTAAPLLEKSLPGNPKVTVENIVGGASAKGTETVWRAEPDGSTIGLLDLGIVMQEMAGLSDYRLAEFSWIGTLSEDFWLTVASPASGITSLEDLIGKDKVTFSTPGLTSQAGIIPHVQQQHFNIGDISVVQAEGSPDALLAVLRGDVQVYTTSANALLDQVAAGKIIPLATTAPERLAVLPDVPTYEELGYEEFAKGLQIGRSVTLPPNTPSEIVDIYKKAFEGVLADEGFKELVTGKMKAKLGTIDPNRVMEIVNETTKAIKPFEELVKNELF